MAKKKNGVDDFNFDNLDLDWNDFDEPPRNKDKKRNPILETGRTIKRSALSAIWPEGKRDQVILKGMPDSATDAYKGYQDAKSVAKDVYAHTKDELVKTERVIKNQARQLGPTMKKYLPDAITRRVDKWARSDEIQGGKYDPEQAGLDRMMAEVFNGQGGGGESPMTAQEQRDAQQQATEDRIRDGVKDMKSDAMLNAVLSIARDTNSTAALTRGVLLNVERKQLELQYRTLFALQDLSKLKQTEFDRNTPALEAIVKNTALPDYAKEDFSEVRWAHVRRQAAEWMNPLKYAEGFMDSIRQKATKKISGAFSDGRGILETIMGMGVEDDFGMEDSSSLSPDARKKNGRDKATGWATKFLAKKLLGPLVEKGQGKSKAWLEDNPQAMSAIERAKFLARGATDGTIANSAIAGESEGFLANLFRMGNTLGVVDPLKRENVFLDERNVENLNRSAKFDRKFYLTVVESLPALLSEINKSIRRGYGEHADVEYDMTTRGITSRRDLADRVRKGLADDKGRQRTQESINSVVDYIDQQKTLEPKERQQLADYIESRAATGKSMDVDAIIKDQSQLHRYMGGTTARKVVDALKHVAAGTAGENWGLSNELHDRISSVQVHYKRRQEAVDQAATIYGERILRDAGIFNYDKKNNVFGVDKDFVDPYTMFNDTRMGKTRSGRALTREQELQRKLQNGSATADYIRRKFGEDAGIEDTLSAGSALNDVAGGKGRYGGGITARQMARVLYGETETNLVDLLGGQDRKNASGETDRLIEAIRATNVTTYVQEILKHVKNMDEEGVLLASLEGGSGPEGGGTGGGDGDGPTPRGGGPRRRRIILGESGLLRRWGGILFDTASGGFNLAKRGVMGAKDRLGKFGSWAKGKLAAGDGPGIFSKLKGLATGGISGAFGSALEFGKGLLGVRDVYDERGKVVLQGKRLEAGEYWQLSEDGNHLHNPKTLDEIQLGMDILDNAGNVILSAADLAAAGKLSYYKGGKLQSLFKAMSHKSGSFLRKVIEAPKKVLDRLSPKAKSIKEWFTTAPDIYVKGETFPRMTSMLMRQGKYLLKATKTPVFSVKDITGPIVDDAGNDIITAQEMQNPDFKLVDKWGRDIKSPLQRIIGRVGSLLSRGKDLVMGIPDMLRKGAGRLKHLATNNPIANWFKGKGGGDFFSNNSLFGGLNTTGKKTNHILIRIYKLLNRRMPGEPEDEGWTEEMEKGTGGGKGVKDAFKSAQRFGRGVKARLNRRWGRRFRNGRASVSDWFRGKRDGLLGWAGGVRDRFNHFSDSMRESEHDLATRYEVERRLAGRDDETADFYRSRLHRKGKFSRNKFKDAIHDDISAAGEAGSEALNAAKGKAQSIGSKLLDRMNRMVNLQEVSWFNTMRSSLEESGAQEGFIRGMYAKFSRRMKFKEGGEKRDYLQWFRRKRADHEGAAASSGGRSGGKVKGVMDLFKSIPVIGPLVSILGTVASVMGTIAKWGIMKPAKLLGQGAWWLAKGGARMLGGAAMRGLIMPVATAAGAVVTAVGWPVILAVGAVVGLTWAAFKIATTTYTEYLDTLRLAQYGFQDYDKWSSDDGAKARYLEKQLKQYVSFNETGQATCRGLGGKEVQELAVGFGVAEDDKSGMLAFQAMMLQRFIPIYLRWLSALYSQERDIQLADVGNANKVSKDEMKSIFNKVQLTKDAPHLRALTDPRNIDRSLWQKFKDAVTFTSPDLLDADDVMDIQEDVLRGINRRMEDKKNRKFNKGAMEARGIEESGVKEAFSALATSDKENRENAPRPNGWEDGTEQIQIQVDQFAVLNQKDVDALESLRFKTYGLKELNPAIVGQLKMLERFVLPNIDIKNASYKGKWTEAMDVIEPQGWKDPHRSEKLRLWFTSRFLPTFMFYVCGFHRFVPTGDPLNLKLTGGYLFELGLLTSRAYNMKADIRQSVWEVAINPFGQDPNMDPSSVSKELETLKVLSKEADLAVRNLLNDKKPMGKRAKWADKNTNTSFYQTKDDGESTFFTAEDQKAAKAAGNFGGGTFTGTPTDINQAVDAMGGAKNYAAISTGSVGIKLGDVEPGSYKQLAEKYPIGSLNSEERIKQMISDVARSMGVPPSVALGMAYAESKFNYKAKNPYASAAGLFQFINSTWDSQLGQYGRQFGIPGQLMASSGGQFDPHANTILGVQFIRDNIMKAQKDLGGKAPPPAVAYLYHFLGPGGGRQFMQAWAKNPNAPATAAPPVTRKVLAGNQSVFYTKQGRLRTLDEVIRELNGRMGSVTASEMTADPSKTKQAISGLSPNAPTSSSPAVSSGAAANDPSMEGTAAGAGQNLPSDNENRRDGALETKGAMAADNAVATMSNGPALPGGTASGSSDMSNVADEVAKQAAADGLSPKDVEKVKAGAAQRTAQTGGGGQAPLSSDMSPAAGGFSNATVADQQLQVTKDIKAILEDMRKLMQTGAPLGPSSPPSGPAPKGTQTYPQPAPSLNVSRKTG